MEFSELVLDTQITTQKLKQFEKKGIYNVNDLIKTYPKYFLDYTQKTNFWDCVNGEKVALHLIIINVVKRNGKKTTYVDAECRDYDTREQILIRWFNPYIYEKIEDLCGMEVVACGVFIEDEWGKKIINPDVFSTDIDNAFRVYPVYRKISGMSEEYFNGIMEASLNQYSPVDSINYKVLEDFGIISENELINSLHKPRCREDVIRANKRLTFEKLYFFAERMVKESEHIEKKSDIKPIKLLNTNKLIQMLPYELTSDQQNVVRSFITSAQKGKRINALIQGDVGSGKTVCAFLLMLSMSDNGYQSVLMAPTGVLAKQHYNELKGYVEPLGLTVVYLDGTVKSKEKKEILSKIKSGEADFVIGTHAVISSGVEYKSLGLTIVDEEHKFGVIQRESLKKKADEGVHSISMSATPIPRSLAMTLYGDALDIYSIESMPNGRKPVKTSVVNEDASIFRFMENEINNGHQCYIVCPLIDNPDLVDSDESDPLESVESVRDKAEKYFEIKDNINIGVITGKTKDEEKTEIINQFKNNEIQILIATTIIEVGVNVPNATVITIMNADRFGLAGLHQLRGRVGRSSLQSYCLLKSNSKDNPRLSAMCSTTNGFKIAEADLQLRGTGDFLGTKQSGDDANIKLMLKYPKYYNTIKEYIKTHKY